MGERNGGYIDSVVASLRARGAKAILIRNNTKSSKKMTNVEMFYRNSVLYVTTTAYNTHIENSYIVKSRKDMRGILECIEYNSLCGDAVRRIPMKTMLREWRAHNLLYALGIARKHTGSVDLNEEHWWRRIGYFVLSLMYWRV